MCILCLPLDFSRHYTHYFSHRSCIAELAVTKIVLALNRTCTCQDVKGVIPPVSKVGELSPISPSGFDAYNLCRMPSGSTKCIR